MINSVSPQGVAQMARAVEGAFAMAVGLLVQARNPLGAGKFAQGMLPAQANVTLGTADAAGKIAPQATWTAAMTGANTAKIDLGDGQRLEIDERNSELTIVNDKTGERTRIWGDPHVEVDGQHKFDFWGTTTFQLENGTKITINTEQWAGNPNMYVASQVVITKGENAIVVDGISQNKIGDLSVTQSKNGYAVDSANRDGYVLHENANGAGWISEHSGAIATQADMDATRVGAEYAPGAKTLSLAEAGNALSLFLFAGQMGRMFDLFTGSAPASVKSDDLSTVRPRRAHPALL